MTWIKTVPLSEANQQLLQALQSQNSLYPQEYAVPVFKMGSEVAGIVGSHSLARIMRACAAWVLMIGHSADHAHASWFNYINRVADSLGVGRDWSSEDLIRPPGQSVTAGSSTR